MSTPVGVPTRRDEPMGMADTLIEAGVVPATGVGTRTHSCRRRTARALGVDDLERLAVAAYLAGDDAASTDAWRARIRRARTPVTRCGRSGARSGSSSVSWYGVKRRPPAVARPGATPRVATSKAAEEAAFLGDGPAHVHGRRRAGARHGRAADIGARGDPDVDAGAARRGADRDHARTHRRWRHPARRGHDRGHGRRDVAHDEVSCTAP